MRAEDRLERYLLVAEAAGEDLALKLEVATECCWGGELRYTPEPNRVGGPDRSTVFFVGACETPLEVITRLLDDFDAWEIEMGKK